MSDSPESTELLTSETTSESDFSFPSNSEGLTTNDDSGTSAVSSSEDSTVGSESSQPVDYSSSDCSVKESAKTTSEDESLSSSNEDEQICRCCLEPGQLSDLIVPCKCSGTSKWIHRKCLDRWRALSQNPESFFQCDTCKEKYQFDIIRRSRFWDYAKYLLLCFFDISLVLSIVSVLIFVCILLVFLLDTRFDIHHYYIRLLFPGFVANELLRACFYIFTGTVFFFFILGCITIVVSLFVLIMKCLGINTLPRGRTSIHDISYHRHRGCCYPGDFCFYYYYPYYSPRLGGGMCMPCCCCFGNPCRSSGSSICGSGGSSVNVFGGSGGSSGDGGGVIGIIIAVVFLIVFIFVATIGVVVGIIIFCYIVYRIISNRIKVLNRKDKTNIFVIKDLSVRQIC